MAAFTIERAEECAEEIVALFDDGFQLTDLFEIIPKIMEIVEAVEEMTGAEKEEAAGVILDFVVDKTDTPWLPDNLTDPFLKKGFRALFPIIAKATKGEFAIN
jgi:hypothetical protein